MHRLRKIGLSVICLGAIYFAGDLMFSQPTCDAVGGNFADGNHGLSVVSLYSGCGPLLMPAGDYVYLQLPSGKSMPIFGYAPIDENQNDPTAKRPAYPSASWRSPNELHISIGVVEKIYLQKEEAEGVHVTYNIGVDLSHYTTRKHRRTRFELKE